ncbi:MAG: DUF58 domain-containing protein [Thermogutta sp.]
MISATVVKKRASWEPAGRPATDTVIVRWAVGAAMLLVIALVLGSAPLAAATYVLLATAVAARLLVRYWAAKVSAVRECNRVDVRIGDKVAFQVELHNHGRFDVPWLMAEDLIPASDLRGVPPRLRLHGQNTAFLRLPKGGSKRLFYQIECMRRGFYRIGPLLAETGDPFGLQRRYRTLAPPQYLLVYPKVVPLEGYDIAAKRPLGEMRLAYQLFEDPTRIAGIRPYQPGDPPRRIHWAATARTGQFQSKVYEPSALAGATLLLDLCPSGYPAGQAYARSELAVSAAASLTHALYLMNEPFGLICNGRDAVERAREEGWEPDPHRRLTAIRIREPSDQAGHAAAPLILPPQRGPQQFQHALELLARVELHDGLSFADLIQEALPRIPLETTAVAFIGMLTAETASALEVVRRRGVQVVAIFNHPSEVDFAAAAARLADLGIETRHLPSEESLPTFCSRYVYR